MLLISFAKGSCWAGLLGAAAAAAAAEMLLAVRLVFSSTVFSVQATSLLHQNQRFQFVGVGDTAQISCTSAEDIQHGGFAFSWYKRRERAVLLIKNCFFNQTPGKFVCRAKGRNLTLEIAQVQKEDSGIYFCAERNYIHFTFSIGSSLIVGDSYTPGTWVMLLQPQAAHDGQNSSNCLACVVHGVANSVQVSWDVPGDLQQEGRTLLVRNSSGSLTFLSLLHIPMDVWRRGELYMCEVRFNSSGTTVRKSTAFPAAVLLAQAGHCPSSTGSLAGATVLSLLLLLLLAVLWVRCGPSRPGFLSSVPESPTSTEPQLDVPLRSQDRKKPRQALQGKKPKSGRTRNKPGDRQGVK